MANSYRRGYSYENYMAKRTGGERVGLRGKSAVDVQNENKWLAIECKERKTAVKWVEGAMCQAEAAVARGEGELAIVAIHWLGENHDKDLIVCRLADWEANFGWGSKGVVGED